MKNEWTDYKILVVDPATTSGWCLVTASDTLANITAYGSTTVPNDLENDGDKCNWLFDWTSKTIDEHNIQHVVEENFFFSKKYATGSPLNIMLRAAIEMAVRAKGLEYTKVNPSNWKNFVAGRSTPTKFQVQKWGKVAAKKLFIQEALWENYGFRFPNHSLSDKTGKPVKLNMDLVDAVGQAVFYCCCICKIPQITLSVPLPENVKIRKTVKTYEYPKTDSSD
jgi:Holliday junction resolvasome RuvABC endonuclease subunit